MDEQNSPQPIQTIPQIQPPVENSLPPKNHHWLSILGVGLLIGLLIGAGGFYVLNMQKTKTQAPITTEQTTQVAPTLPTDETANWKTYTNPTYHYSIKFPNTFEVPPQSEREISQLGKDSNMCVQEKATTTCRIVINVYQNTVDISTEDWIKQHPSLIIDKPTVAQTTINGLQVQKLTNSNKTAYVFTYGPNIVVLLSETNAQYQKIMDTFQFTDQKHVNDFPKKEYFSLDKSYLVTTELVGDYNKISILDKDQKVITDDLVKKNSGVIAYDKLGCQCGTNFKKWEDNSHFTISILNANGNEYDYTVDAVTGLVDTSSFKKVK